MGDVRRIKALYGKLHNIKREVFPKERRQPLNAPEEAGVYVIYDPKGKVDHVGESTSIARRLRDHMGARSSYVIKSLNNDGSQLRSKRYKFRCLPVSTPRQRMLLQALAIGLLCPRHIGDRSLNAVHNAVRKRVNNR